MLHFHCWRSRQWTKGICDVSSGTKPIVVASVDHLSPSFSDSHWATPPLLWEVTTWKAECKAFPLTGCLSADTEGQGRSYVDEDVLRALRRVLISRSSQSVGEFRLIQPRPERWLWCGQL